MTLTRRELLAGAAAGGLAIAAGCAGPSGAQAKRAPALFISHGSPRQAIVEDDYAQALRTFAAARPAPAAIAIVSAHWLRKMPVRVTTSERPATIHDFRGFERALYEKTYPCPGEPALARETLARLSDGGVAAEADAQRGLDHGVWVPLSILYPSASIPVVAISLPSYAEPAQVLAIGRALAPLRERNVLVIGSGGMTHNFDLTRDDGTDDWAREFDAWAAAKARSLDVDALSDWEKAAPQAELAHPFTEHWDPIYAVVGAASSGERVTDVYAGFRGNFSMRCFSVG